MTRRLGSLSNRIFLTSALLAVVSIGVAMWLVNATVTAQAEREIQRGLEEAGGIVEQYRALAVTQLAQQARLIADLPKLKAAVDLDDPPTVAPLAADYRRKINSDVLGADLFVIVGRSGRLLAAEGLTGEADRRDAPAWAAVKAALRGQESTFFLPKTDSVRQVVTVPIWEPSAPDVLGALSVGVALDERLAAQIKRVTDSDIAFGLDGRVRASTLPHGASGALAPLLHGRPGGRVHIGPEEYVALVQPMAGNLSAPGRADRLEAAGPRREVPTPVVLVLRSRTERLRPLRALHTALFVTAGLAVLMATVLSYLVARTITRPLAAITAAMRETASTGDLTRRLALPEGNPWDDEDARLLASSFNTMTASIARFQREAAQRERLSSLGRLSTVLAHEIRNPLMIIKAALRTLRRSNGGDPRLASATNDIDGEVDRLNRLVNEVLDFARPIRFELEPASLSAICRGAVEAAEAGTPGPPCEVSLDLAADAIVTDAERLRQALVNLLANARQAASAGRGEPAGTDGPPGSSGQSGSRAHSPAVRLASAASRDRRVTISIRDRGPGIEPDHLPRIFDPYFTTKRTGTGIGLAITRNIVEGLGGTISVRSRVGQGTEVTIDLPSDARQAVTESRS